MVPQNFLINEHSDFAKDLGKCAALTELNGFVFPVLFRPKMSKTAQYAAGQNLNNCTSSAKFEGATFKASINTYLHKGGSSICLVEDLEWAGASIVNDTWSNFSIEEAAERGLRMRDSFMPVFLVVSNKPTTLWGVHSDGGLVRTHHVLASGDCRMQFFEGSRMVSETKFIVGKSYEFDVSRPHNVVAHDSRLRVNLVTDLEPR